MTSEKLEELVMELVSYAGEGRSYAMEALRFARNGEFEKADEALKHADKALLEAHHTQTELIQSEINGEAINITLLLVHAQDHLMTAMLAKDLIYELVEDKKNNYQK